MIDRDEKIGIIMSILEYSKAYTKMTIPIHQQVDSDGITDVLKDKFTEHASDKDIDLLIDQTGLIMRQYMTTQKKCIGISEKKTQVCSVCGVILINAPTDMDNVCSACANEILNSETGMEN